MTPHLGRRAALRQRLTAAGLGALVVTRLVNVRYLTGFTGSAGRLLVTADGRDEAFATDGRYAEQAAAQVAGVDLLTSRGTEWIGERLARRGRLGVESHALPWDAARELAAALPGVEVVPAPHHVETLRQRKDAAELDAITRACRIGDEAFTALLAWLAPGQTEREVARRLDTELVDRGASGPAFATIVAAGAHGARPHHQPGERRLSGGDLVILDFGALVDGYASDMTRTVAVGHPAPEARDLYHLVHRAQAAGVAAVADGASAGTVDAACREVFAAAGRAEAFVHPTGHGLGLEIHEEPILRAGAAATLAASMAVTVEPGLYVPGLGGVRIEDTVAVNPPGPDGSPRAQVLTGSPKDLIVL